MITSESMKPSRDRKWRRFCIGCSLRISQNKSCKRQSDSSGAVSSGEIWQKIFKNEIIKPSNIPSRNHSNTTEINSDHAKSYSLLSRHRQFDENSTEVSSDKSSSKTLFQVKRSLSNQPYRSEQQILYKNSFPTDSFFTVRNF